MTADRRAPKAWIHPDTGVMVFRDHDGKYQVRDRADLGCFSTVNEAFKAVLKDYGV